MPSAAVRAERVLECIRGSDGVGIEQIAEVSGLTALVVRYSIVPRLEREGLITRSPRGWRALKASPDLGEAAEHSSARQ